MGAGGCGPAPEPGARRVGDGGSAGWTPTRKPPQVVSWIFAQRLAGYGLARITRALNDTCIPCPHLRPQSGMLQADNVQAVTTIIDRAS
jgi:hypothetical protein